MRRVGEEVVHDGRVLHEIRPEARRQRLHLNTHTYVIIVVSTPLGVAQYPSWTQAQKGPGSNRSRDAVG